MKWLYDTSPDATAEAVGAFLGAKHDQQVCQKQCNRMCLRMWPKIKMESKRKMQHSKMKDIQTRWCPLSSTVISALPSLTRNERANIFSTVSEKDPLFSTRFCSLTFLFLRKISNMVDIFFSVSAFTSDPASTSCKFMKERHCLREACKQSQSTSTRLQLMFRPTRHYQIQCRGIKCHKH